MAKKYVVHLTEAERATLLQIVAVGKVAARTGAHAHILRQQPMRPEVRPAGRTSKSSKPLR